MGVDAGVNTINPVANIALRGRGSLRAIGIVKVADVSVDIVRIAKLLKCINDKEREGRPPGLKELIGCGFSYHTIEKYIPLLRAQGLIEVEKRGRGKAVRLTRKGLDFIFSVQQALTALGVSLDEV